jgi:hypothetical protein
MARDKSMEPLRLTPIRSHHDEEDHPTLASSSTNAFRQQVSTAEALRQARQAHQEGGNSYGRMDGNRGRVPRENAEWESSSEDGPEEGLSGNQQRY